MPPTTLAPRKGRFLGPISIALSWFCLAVAAAAALGLVVMIGGLSLDAAGLLPKDSDSVVVRFGTDAPPSIERVTAPPGESAKVTVQTSAEGPTLNGPAVAGLAVAAGLPLLALIWGLWHGSRLFKRLAKEEYFARPTVAALRNFSIGLLIYKALPLISLPLFGWALATWAPGTLTGHVKRSAGFTLNPMEMDGFLTLIFLGMIVIFAQIMTKAAELAEDNAQIV